MELNIFMWTDFGKSLIGRIWIKTWCKLWNNVINLMVQDANCRSITVCDEILCWPMLDLIDCYGICTKGRRHLSEHLRMWVMRKFNLLQLLSKYGVRNEIMHESIKFDCVNLGCGRGIIRSQYFLTPNERKMDLVVESRNERKLFFKNGSKYSLSNSAVQIPYESDIYSELFLLLFFYSKIGYDGLLSPFLYCRTSSLFTKCYFD